MPWAINTQDDTKSDVEEDEKKKGELEKALRKTAKDELRKSKNSKTVAEDARKAAKQVENNSIPNPRTMCD